MPKHCFNFERAAFSFEFFFQFQLYVMINSKSGMIRNVIRYDKNKVKNIEKTQNNFKFKINVASIFAIFYKCKAGVLLRSQSTALTD